MKARNYVLIALAAITVSGGAFFAGRANAQPAPAPFAGPERHPEIHKAIRQLNNAYSTMKNAADDFGGHKARAMRSTQDAINELNDALKFDRH